jgi:hypothetical protein
LSPWQFCLKILRLHKICRLWTSGLWCHVALWVVTKVPQECSLLPQDKEHDRHFHHRHNLKNLPKICFCIVEVTLKKWDGRFFMFIPSMNLCTVARSRWPHVQKHKWLWTAQTLSSYDKITFGTRLCGFGVSVRGERICPSPCSMPSTLYTKETSLSLGFGG